MIANVTQVGLGTHDFVRTCPEPCTSTTFHLSHSRCFYRTPPCPYRPSAPPSLSLFLSLFPCPLPPSKDTCSSITILPPGISLHASSSSSAASKLTSAQVGDAMTAYVIPTATAPAVKPKKVFTSDCTLPSSSRCVVSDEQSWQTRRGIDASKSVCSQNEGVGDSTRWGGGKGPTGVRGAKGKIVHVKENSNPDRETSNPDRGKCNSIDCGDCK